MPVSLISHPSLVDVQAEVVDAFALFQSGEKRQEEADELFLSYQFHRDFRFVGAHLGDRFAYLLCRGAGGKCGDADLQPLFLFYIEGEAAFIVRRPWAGRGFR